MGHFKSAAQAYLRSYRLYLKARDHFGQLTLALKLGDVHRQLEEFKKALNWYDRALRIAFSLRTPLSLDARLGKALCFRALGQLSRAELEFRKCLPAYKKLRDAAGMAYANWALATTYRFLGRLNKGVKHAKAAVRIYNELDDLNGLAYARCALGGLFRLQGLARDSGRLYKSANAFFRDSGDKFGTAYSECGQGNAKRMQRLYHDALRHFGKAENLYRQLGQKSPLGFVLWNQSQAYLKLGNKKEAMKKLTEAKRFFSVANDIRGLVYFNLGMGELFRGVKELFARRCYNRAFVISQKFELRFEHEHARRALGFSKNFRGYRKLGVNLNHFSSYQSLP